MEDFFKMFEEKSQAQKIIIVLAITILLLLFITVMFVISTPKQKSSSNSLLNDSQSSTNTSQNSLPNSSGSPQIKNYTYVGNHFQVTYNMNIYKASGNKNNGGDNILLEHLGSPNFSINFLIASSSSVPVQGIYNIFGAFKFPQNLTSFKGVPAVRFVGTVKSNTQTFTDDAIVFTKDNLTYKFQLTYRENNNPKIESAYNQILSTVKIN